MRFRSEPVQYMPKELAPGVLYISRPYETAAHLCACGCGGKVRTPLGLTEWSVEETAHGPTLWPSVGNWQRPCRTHYYIDRGVVRWASPWTDEEVAAGRRGEEQRREAYFESRERDRAVKPRSFWGWMRSLFKW